MSLHHLFDPAFRATPLSSIIHPFIQQLFLSTYSVQGPVSERLCWMNSWSGKVKDMHVLASPKRGSDVTVEQGQGVYPPNTHWAPLKGQRAEGTARGLWLGLKEKQDVDTKRCREGASLGGRNSMSQGSEGGEYSSGWRRVAGGFV